MLYRLLCLFLVTHDKVIDEEDDEEHDNNSKRNSIDKHMTISSGMVTAIKFITLIFSFERF